MNLRALTSALAISAFSIPYSNQLTAPTITTGDIVGIVTDASGAQVHDAAVTLTSSDINATATTKTNEYGQYRLRL